jgi:hypothetical protein
LIVALGKVAVILFGGFVIALVVRVIRGYAESGRILRKAKDNQHPVLWSVEKDGPWKGTPNQERLFNSRAMPQRRFEGFYQMRNERWDATTPIPHPDDRASCPVGNSWRRADRADYHRHRDGGICEGPLTIVYVNPPFLVNLPRVEEPPPYRPEAKPLVQGWWRGGWRDLRD